MTAIYLNYPNGQITVHRNPNCSFVRQQRVSTSREFFLDAEQLSKSIKDLLLTAPDMASAAGKNDAWVFADFGDSEQEEALAELLQVLWGRRYKPIREARLTHCGHCSL